MKKLLTTVVKFAISAAILSYLFYRASRDESFADLYEQPKQWGLLAAAVAVAFAAVSTTFVRWYFLVRTLNVPIRLSDAFRLGFIGYLFNFFTFGVPGDLLKAIFLCREHPERKVEAASSVVVDRLYGLHGLFLVAAVAYWSLDFGSLNARSEQGLDAIHTVGTVATIAALIGLLGALLLVIPGVASARFWDSLTRSPRLGGLFTRLVTAMRLYSGHPAVLFGSVGLSVCTHVLFSICIFLIASGLPGEEYPSLMAHFTIVPIANLANSIPLPGGLGGFELALDFLYRSISSIKVAPRHGFVIALAFRIVTLMIAAIGAVYYLSHKREVDQLMEEAEREQQEGSLAEAGA